MKKWLVFLFLCLPFSQAQAVPPFPKPQLMAVYFYADWCSNCKILSPIYKEARAKGGLDKKDIVFITLDLTDKTTIHQSILLAQGLGIADYLRAQGSATGYVAILDAGSKKELTRFDNSASPDAIIQGINGFLKP